MVEQFVALLVGSASGGKSTALRPIQWTLGIVSGALIVSVATGAPKPILWLFGSATAVALILFFVAYFYLMFNKPDYLRSEWHSIEMKRLDKGLIGDSTSGLRSVGTKSTVDRDQVSTIDGMR